MSLPGDPQPVDRISSDMSRLQKTQAAQRLSQFIIAQIYTENEMNTLGDWEVANPMAAVTRQFQTLEQRRTKEKARSDEIARAEQADAEEALPIENLQETAEQFSRKNPELQPRSLLLLRSRIHKGDSPEEILRKVREFYADPVLADDALDFLSQTAEKTLKETIRKSKEELNRLFDREIKAGRNMSLQAREFASQGLGTPNTLRDLYRDITGNPRDANALFEELSAKYPFEKMKSVIDFMLHSLGADLKAKGPSISRAELARLFTETRNMQAILGVFRFFKSRMRLIMSSFERQGLLFPGRITFDILAKLFMRLLQERYPSADKAMQILKQLGMSEELAAKIILLVQYRDAMRQVAPKLFRDERHRQDLLMACIEALEELDEQQEKEEEEEEKKKQK